MYAIVAIAGQQFKVEPGHEIFVHRQDGKEGDKLEFGNVLLLVEDGKLVTTVAAPKVSATILSHVKGDKVIAFKKTQKGIQEKNWPPPIFYED